MRDFVFQHPTAITFGRDALARVGEKAAALGKRALLVTGRESSSRHGSRQQALASLRAAGLSVVELQGVPPNPPLSQARSGIRLARQEGIELLVALGGGSVIDCAKAIAAGSLVAHDVWLFFRGKKSIRTALPVVAVPTLAGSGSETSSGMVLTHDERREKIGIGNRLLFPRAALLDPLLTCTASPAATAYGTVDAISHLLEFYLFREESSAPLQDGYSEGLMKTLMAACETALADPDHYRARAELLWASSLALNGLSAAGLGKVALPCHLLEHALSGLHDLPHGAGLAALLPGLLRHQAERDPGRLARFATRVLDLAGAGEKELAWAGIERFAAWLQAIGTPTSLGDLGLTSRDLPGLCAQTREQARLWRLSRYGPEVVLEILAASL